MLSMPACQPSIFLTASGIANLLPPLHIHVLITATAPAVVAVGLMGLPMPPGFATLQRFDEQLPAQYQQYIYARESQPDRRGSR